MRKMNYEWMLLLHESAPRKVDILGCKKQRPIPFGAMVAPMVWRIHNGVSWNSQYPSYQHHMTDGESLHRATYVLIQ